jgi:DNA-binding NtrC family response regulator
MLNLDFNCQPRIMVVDDDLAMRGLLRSFLVEHGCSAITIGTAEEAVKLYNVDRPAAVILDMVMPGSMDGLDALAAFKKIDPDVPIIVLSGEGGATTIVRAMKLGASDFVSKPFDEAELEVPLTNALRQHHTSTPTEIAVAAVRAGNYSLKSVSRAAAREAERELISIVLRQTHWHRRQTADILGISYKALLYKIKQNGLHQTGSEAHAEVHPPPDVLG